MSALVRRLARVATRLFPSTPPGLEAIRDAPGCFLAVDIPADMLGDLRGIPTEQWRTTIAARHEAEEWAAGLTDDALAGWIGAER